MSLKIGIVTNENHLLIRELPPVAGLMSKKVISQRAEKAGSKCTSIIPSSSRKPLFKSI